MNEHVSEMLLVLADIIKGFGGRVGVYMVTGYLRSMIAEDGRDGAEQRGTQSRNCACRVFAADTTICNYGCSTDGFSPF